MGTTDSKIADTFTCYEEIAEDYDQLKEFNIVAQAEERVLLSLIRDVKTHAILDVGCGTGRYTKLLEDLGARMVGVDISEKMIHIAKTKTEIACYIAADALHLPFRDSIFHIVLSALVVNHIENLRLFLTEMLRTCRKRRRTRHVFHLERRVAGG